MKIKKLPHTKRVYKKKKRGGSQHYWVGRKSKKKIKSDRKLYLKLYEEADHILQVIGIEKVCKRCSIIKLYRTQTKHCCAGCKYRGKSGCTTKSLACKLWLCDYKIQEKIWTSNYAKDWARINRIAKKHGWGLNIVNDYEYKHWRKSIEEHPELRQYYNKPKKVKLRFYHQKYGYRVLTGGVPGTVLDVIRFEKEELGNDPVYNMAKATKIPLHKYPANHSIWVTNNRTEAKLYRSVNEPIIRVPIPHQTIILANLEGQGYLLFNPKHSFRHYQ